MINDCSLGVETQQKTALAWFFIVIFLVCSLIVWRLCDRGWAVGGGASIWGTLRIPYFLDQTLPSRSRCPRIVAVSLTHLGFIVVAFPIRTHWPRPLTVSMCFASGAISYTQVQKRSYDDAFKLNAASEKTTNRAAARKFKVDRGIIDGIHAYSSNTMKVLSPPSFSRQPRIIATSFN